MRFTRTNFKTTIKRLRNCYMCPNRQLSDQELCNRCPPLEMMKEFNYIIDYYFDTLKQKKYGEQKEKEKK